MWLITNFGFFSVVQKPGQEGSGWLTIRSRVRDDLEALRRNYLPSMGDVLAHQGTDYRYRAVAPAKDIAKAFSEAIADIDYSNFKESVADRQGVARSRVYSAVWEDLGKLSDESDQSPPRELLGEYADDGSELPRAYGAVVRDGAGRILLRKPANEFDGYVWTFPKGRAEGDEPVATAVMRELREETGVEGRIHSRLPWVFRGGSTANVYFLMSLVRDHGEFDRGETEQVVRATPSEARELISQTRNKTGRQRDLCVLEQALRAFEELVRDKV